MMKAPENVALLVDAIVFLQNNFSLGVLLHPPKDILVRNPALSLFRGILPVGEQIIPQLFKLLEAPL